MKSQMDTSSKKTNNDSAAQPTTSQQQVLHKAAPAGTEQADLMGWEMASRRQRGRDVIEGSPPGNQPARKDMRTQQQEGLLTASAASNKQKQTAPPRGNATGQPAATQRAGQKPKQVQQQRKNGKEPAAGASPDAPPPSRVPFTAATQPTISAWAKSAQSDVEVQKANLGRQQAIPAADAAGLTAEAAKARQSKRDAVAAAHLAASAEAAEAELMAAPEEEEEVGYVLISHPPPPSQEVNRPALRAFSLLGRIVADLERNNGSQVGGEEPPIFENAEAMMAEWTELATLNGIPSDLATETGRTAGGESRHARDGEHMGSHARMGKGKARASHVNAEHTAVCPESPSGQCSMPKCLTCALHPSLDMENKFKGIKIGDKHYKLIQFADDTPPLIGDWRRESKYVDRGLLRWCKATGMRENIAKREAVALGAYRGRRMPDGPETEI